MDARWPVNAEAVTVYAREAANADAVLAVVSPLGTGDTFCVAVPVENLADDVSGVFGESESEGEGSGARARLGAGTGKDALGALGGLDGFDDADLRLPYSATISDTIATFVVEVVQDPQFGELPTALKDTGWDAAQLTGYEISVASLGPGSDRLRYRLAKALLEVTGGVLVGADGARIEVESLADPTWGSLW